MNFVKIFFWLMLLLTIFMLSIQLYTVNKYPTPTDQEAAKFKSTNLGFSAANLSLVLLILILSFFIGDKVSAAHTDSSYDDSE